MLVFSRANSYLLLLIIYSRLEADLRIFDCYSVKVNPLFPYHDSLKACSISAPKEMRRMIKSIFCLIVAEMRGRLIKFYVLPMLGSAPFERSNSASSNLCQWTAVYKAVAPFLSLQFTSTPLSIRYREALMALASRSSFESSFLQGWLELATSCALMSRLTVLQSTTWMLTGWLSAYQMKRSTQALLRRSKATLSCSVGCWLGCMQWLQALTRPLTFPDINFIMKRVIRCSLSDWETGQI